ncbi:MULTISPECIES: DedA family protein [unclassified Amycolatopsis]|uniref:DedA family protein n=1 Tax=unclassified Amycolatopsis TaxID=2618356 RepID=UPI0028763C4E|nr:MULTISPECIES: DedA family protein [unclassified Amycolatopsis]MDS0140364.1 DedA family protein [Amycolatopsis sp. 505]MDS0149031.1 DedA family protein [Amycolatopsis sp. CM201R]
MTAPTTAGEMTGVAGWAVGLMESLGGPGAALVVGLDNLFPPLPSELVLPLAGFAAGRGSFSLGGALFWTTLGSVAGAVVVYLLGQRLGHDRTRRLVGRIPLVKTADFDRTATWFARHGGKAVFFGRMIPVFRSLVSLPAGVERMPFGRFLLYTTAGSLLWNTGFVVAGYLLGEHWQLVERYAAIFQYVVFAAIAVAIGVFVVRRVRGRKPV